MQNFNELIEDVFLNKTCRQVAGDMLDNAHEVLKLFIETWAKSSDTILSRLTMKEDFEKSQRDLLGAINFFINNYESIMRLQQKESKFLKSLLFELKHFRNNWAHSKDFTMREIYRIQDTIIMIFEELNLQIQTKYYMKGNLLREQAAIKLGEESKLKMVQRIQQQQMQEQQLKEQMQAQQFKEQVDLQRNFDQQQQQNNLQQLLYNQQLQLQSAFNYQLFQQQQSNFR